MLIQINNSTIVQFNLFEKSTCIEDLEDLDCEGCFETQQNEINAAAKKLLRAFGDHWTPQFLINLRNEIDEKLEQHNKQFGTKF